MVQARFINDTTVVNVRSESDIGRVGIKSGGDHSLLTNRDLPNQHPMSAISGLEEQLQTYIYEQAEADDTWVIQHNLGKYPSVTIVDSSGNEFYPAVKYDNENQCTIYMNGATTGKAFLN